MNERYELLGKLNTCKREIEEQLRYVVCLRKVKGFGQKMMPVIRKFDAAFKAIPKTISFTQDQKPVALQEFVAKFEKKVENRKEHLLNRYTREIEQLRERCGALSKKVHEHTINFCDDIQHYQQRFRRQTTVRKQMYEEAAEKLKANSPSESGNLQAKFDQRLEEEMKRIQTTYEAELKTQRQALELVRSEIKDAELSAGEGDVLRLIESHRREMDFLEKQKEDQIAMQMKQKDAITWNIMALKERIENIKAASSKLAESSTEHVQKLRYEVESSKSQFLMENRDKAKNLQAKILILNNALQNKEVTSENVETRIAREVEQREALIKDIESSKRKDFQKLLKDKEHHLAILKRECAEIHEEFLRISQHRKVEETKRKEKLEEENRKELMVIQSEMVTMREQMKELASPEKQQRISKIISLLEEIERKKELLLKDSFIDSLSTFLNDESEQELQSKSQQMNEICQNLLQIYQLSILADHYLVSLYMHVADSRTRTEMTEMVRSLQLEIKRIKRMEMAKLACLWSSSAVGEMADLVEAKEAPKHAFLPELAAHFQQENRLRAEVEQEKLDLEEKQNDYSTALKLILEISLLEQTISHMTESHCKRNTPLPPLHS